MPSLTDSFEENHWDLLRKKGGEKALVDLAAPAYILCRGQRQLPPPRHSSCNRAVKNLAAVHSCGILVAVGYVHLTANGRVEGWKGQMRQRVLMYKCSLCPCFVLRVCSIGRKRSTSRGHRQKGQGESGAPAEVIDGQPRRVDGVEARETLFSAGGEKCGLQHMHGPLFQFKQFNPFCGTLSCPGSMRGPLF
eukprot:scaffold5759_cov26-Tisochrysis_lutea.AAC.1